METMVDHRAFANFSFPLNVYAYVLAMEPQGLRYLHYGWYDDPGESIAVAQERSAQGLLVWLPSPPARILEVGVGIGTTLALLRERGYDAIGITPDAAQIAYIRQRYGEDFPVTQVRFEDMDALQGEFDCILFHESSQYIPLEQVISRAATLLRPGGSLIIIDEVIPGEPQAGEHLHPLARIKSEAVGAGFSLVDELDLSRRAAPTLEFRLAGTARHRDELRRFFSLENDQLDALDESNRKYIRNYASGVYGYSALRFRLAGPSPRWVAADLPASRSAEMLPLFREVFGHDLGEKMKVWKYGEDRSRAFGVWNREGKLVGHYGGFFRSLAMFGKPAQAFQIGDVMVHPSERAVMTLRGAFFLAASGFFDHYVGKDKPRCLAFGFPNQRAIKIGQRLGVYAAVEKIHLRHWPAEGAGLPFWYVIEPLFERADWQRVVDDLWRQHGESATDFVLVRRDAAYVDFRYRERPDGGYGVHLVRNRFTGRPKAVVVVKQRDAGLDWMDYLGPRAAIPVATEAVRKLAMASGVPQVNAWLTSCMLKDFAGGGGAVHDTDVEIAQSDWNQSRGLAEKTCGHWWLMYGDTDFL